MDQAKTDFATEELNLTKNKKPTFVQKKKKTAILFGFAAFWCVGCMGIMFQCNCPNKKPAEAVNTNFEQFLIL